MTFQSTKVSISEFLKETEKNSQGTLRSSARVAELLETINRVTQDCNDALVNTPDGFFILFLDAMRNARAWHFP